MDVNQYHNVKHDLSESAYNDRRAVCENISELLNVKAQRDATKEQLDTIKDKITEGDYYKALYVIQENERVKTFSRAIQEDDIKTLGKLFYQSHEGLSKKYKVSCKELDFLVESAKANPNVIGSRMMGGGFGGCTINIILKSDYKRFKKDISKKFQKEFGNACSVYKVKLSKGTHILK
ncbi:MAG: galactokinase [Winogradskyella sp.]|uniref:galactokinase n=1 Tax=Winogradskyella sp. TaxID=1883156 RepID=UPI00385977F3